MTSPAQLLVPQTASPFHTRMLAARLNWTPQSRVNSVLASLTRKGHVGRRGERFVVIPEELAGGAAS